MTVSIVSRADWGAKPWKGTPDYVSRSLRREFFVHYDGASHINYTGTRVPQAIERTHLNQGWSGVGYNFVIDQDGVIYEGRGWDLQGAHCPNHNVSGLGVQFAIGGNQEPSPKALASCRALYEEACHRFGRTLAKKGHKDGFATLCPGTRLYAWVRAGMPAGDYKPAPTPDSPPPAPSVARYKVSINGLEYGYGASGEHVTFVGQALVNRGFGKHYQVGPSEQWSDADTKNYADFQKSLGLSGKDANGVPGESSLKELLSKLPASTKPQMPPFPGRQYFVLGAKNKHAKQLQTWLHQGKWGPRYLVGPSEKMTKKDLDKVKALQKHFLAALGPADGLTGPKTWQYAWEVATGKRKK
ncbi:peptidoglycan-binding protein [Streptomyces sp. NPDC018055]|uniref:peptidoglycan-binding protein n=1 Tax=Streptomyces sp. NPDC018055 TaxID=3365038 RepID=UPI00379FB11E